MNRAESYPTQSTPQPEVLVQYSDNIDPVDHALLRDLASEFEATTIARVYSMANRTYLLNGRQALYVLKRAGTGPETFAPKEAAILDLLAAQDPPSPLQLPELVRYDPQEGVLVIKGVDGYAETESGIMSMPEEQRRGIGEQVGDFAGWLASINRDEVRTRLISAGEPFIDWETPLAAMGAFRDERFPVTERLAQQLFAELSVHYPNGLRTDSAVPIHDDLKPYHLIFKDLATLRGLVDMEAITLGQVERSLHTFSQPHLAPLLDACLAAYQRRTGEAVDKTLVEWWHRTHTVMNLCFQLQRGIPRIDRFLLSKNRAIAAFPDADWTELLAAVTANYVPEEGSWDNELLWNKYAKIARTANLPGGERRVLSSQQRGQLAMDALAQEMAV